MANILLIIPCYNEEQRLDIRRFLGSSEEISFLFANDGSSDKTAELISPYVDNKRVYFYDGKINRGKANVIFDAYNKAKEQEIIDHFDWIGYWDADLATPLYEVENMLSYVKGIDNVEAIWGSRVSRLGSNIRRSPKRHYLGRIFATIVGFILGVKAYDSQCGSKLFSKKYAQIAFKETFITNWIFDVEILLRTGEKGIVEYPLLEWTDVPGSKVNLLGDIHKVLRDIYLLWKKY